MRSTAKDAAVIAVWAKRARSFSYWSVVALAVMAFAWGASVHARAVNHTAGKDQGAYLALARRMVRTHAMALDGARPPLYPALLTFAWHDGNDKQQFFESARSFTIVLAVFGWFAFLFALRRSLRPLTALAVWLAAGFSLWMFYAPYVKAESLFFPCATASFMLLVEQLRWPRYGTACVAGGVSGVAQLLKASLAPSLWLFVAVQAVLVALDLRKSPRPLRDGRVRRRFGASALVVAVFFAVVSPYLVANTRVFGRPFYNVNSDFYMWNDSWADTWRGTRGHHDREGFPELPPDKLPSAKRYFEKHRAAVAIKRLTRGAAGLWEGAAAGPGFLEVTLFALFIGLGSFAVGRRLRPTLRSYWPLALFASAYFAGYFVLYFWFYAINPGLRFVAALVGPALFMAGCAADRSPLLKTRWARAVPALLAGSLLVAAPTIVSFVRTWGSAGW